MRQALPYLVGYPRVRMAFDRLRERASLLISRSGEQLRIRSGGACSREPIATLPIGREKAVPLFTQPGPSIPLAVTATFQWLGEIHIAACCCPATRFKIDMRKWF